MQTAKFVVLFLIWSAKTKSSVTVKMLNSYQSSYKAERGKNHETVS